MKSILVLVLMLATLPVAALSNDAVNTQQSESSGQPDVSSRIAADRLASIASLREQRREISRQIRAELSRLPLSERPQRAKPRLDRAQFRYARPLRPARIARLHHRATRFPRGRF